MQRIGLQANSWHVNKEEVSFQRVAAAPKLISIEAAPQRITLDLQRTAIIVVDMQNDFCSKGGWLDHIGANYEVLQQPIKPLQTLLPKLRSRGVPVIWLNWGNRSDRANLSPSIIHVYNQDGVSQGIGDPLANGSKVLEKGSWGAALVDELQPEPEDIHVDKYRMSGFWDTPLDSILRNLRIDTVLFAGVNLDQCVMATLQDAVNSGYDAVLLEDCSATNSPSYCTDATIFNVKQCYGFVASSTDIVGAIQE